MEIVIRVGDKMKFSMELLKHIHDMPDHQTEEVVVVGITEIDGRKVMDIARVE